MKEHHTSNKTTHLGRAIKSVVGTIYREQTMSENLASPETLQKPKNKWFRTAVVEWLLTVFVVGGLEAVCLLDWRSLCWATGLLILLRLHAAFWHRVLPERWYLVGLICGFLLILLPLAAIHYVIWTHWLNPIAISTSTTFITKPLTSDGKRVDMFHALEKRITPPNPPLENGFRLMVEQFGPAFAFYCSYPFPIYLKTRWEQITDKLQLDSEVAWNSEPQFVFRSPRQMLEDTEKTKNPPPDQKEQQDDYWKNFREMVDARYNLFKPAWDTPWTAEELPDAAQWLEENNVFFDVLGRAVRAPVFFEPFCRGREDDDLRSCFGYQSQAARIAGYLSIRIYYHLGCGDIEKAWYDAMTRLRFAAQQTRFSFHPTQAYGLYSPTFVLDILKYSRPTLEQIRRFRQEAEPFLEPPDEMTLENQKFGGRLLTLDHCLRFTYSWGWGQGPIFRMMAWNQALVKMNRRFDAAWQESLDRAASPRISYSDGCIRHGNLSVRRIIRTLIWYGPFKWFPGLFADEILADTEPADLFYCCPMPLQGYDVRMAETAKAMIRLGLLLAEHKAEQGAYPETLGVFDSPIVIDPFSRNWSFQYERRPDGSCQFYSIGSNGIDEQGASDPNEKTDDISVVLP